MITAFRKKIIARTKSPNALAHLWQAKWSATDLPTVTILPWASRFFYRFSRPHDNTPNLTVLGENHFTRDEVVSQLHKFDRYFSWELQIALFFFNFPVSLSRPEKLCDFYWLQLRITCKSGWVLKLCVKSWIVAQNVIFSLRLRCFDIVFIGHTDIFQSL